MDLSYITKLANFNQACSDAKEIRNKVAKENEQIIQQRVEQSTNYFKLEEKYKQLEYNYEQLQQNLLEVQMQREKLSEDYVKERRMRHEILNKVVSTREMCAVLIKHTKNLEESQSRHKANQAALCDAYNKANDVVKDIKQNYKLTLEKQQNEINTLEEKVAILNENRCEMSQYWESYRQESQARLVQIEAEGQRMGDQKEQLVRDNASLIDKMQANIAVNKQKDQKIAELEKDIKHIILEVEKHRSEMNSALQQQRQINENLNKSLSEQEIMEKELDEENSKLKESLNAADDKITQYEDQIGQLKIELIKLEESSLEQRKDDDLVKDKLMEDIQERDQLIEVKNAEISELMNNINSLQQDLQSNKEIISQLNEEIVSQNQIIVDNQQQMETANAEIVTLTDQIAETGVKFNELLCDWKKAKEDMYPLNETIDKQYAELKEEKAKYSELEKKYQNEIEQLQHTIEDKVVATTMDKKYIFELNDQKEALEEKVRELENRVNDMMLESEVTSLKATTKSLMHQDDNAVMASPMLPVENTYLVKKDIYNMNTAFSDGSQENSDLNGSKPNKIFKSRNVAQRKI